MFKNKNLKKDLAAQIRVFVCGIQLPAGARVSRDCRDLLLRLLERDPDSRISFDEFFLHPFVDLEHMASAESLDKAVSVCVCTRVCVCVCFNHLNGFVSRVLLLYIHRQYKLSVSTFRPIRMKNSVV